MGEGVQTVEINQLKSYSGGDLMKVNQCRWNSGGKTIYSVKVMQ